MGPSPSPRGLSAYLALPLDQYSLLDPGWISRSPSSPDVFVLRVPLFDLVGLELQPQITVRVSLDPRNSQVHFNADQFKVGDPRFDEDFKLAMRATLRNKPVPTLRPLRSIKRMWARAGGRGNAAAGAGGAAGAAAASGVGAAAAWQSPSPSATAALGQGGSDSTDNATDADAEDDDVVVQIVDGDGEDGGGPGISRAARAAAYGSGGSGGGDASGGRAPRNSYGVYEPAGVVDVDLEVCGVGPRAAPVVPPHVTVVRGETGGTWAGSGSDMDRADPLAAISRDRSDSISSSSGGVSGNDKSSKGGSSAQQGSFQIAWSVDNGSSSSSSSRNMSAAAAPVTKYESGGGRGKDEGAQVWPPGAYGPAHPAAATAAAAAPGTSGSAGSNVVSPMRPAVTSATLAPTPSLTPAPTSPHPSAHQRAAGAVVEAEPARQGVGIGPVAVTVGYTSPPAPASVAAAAAATTPAVSPGSPAGAPSGSGPLPFIEDSVLYVPASQWGRSSDAGRPDMAAAVPTSSTLRGHGSGGADIVAARPGPSVTALQATVAPVRESDRSGRGPAEEPGPVVVPVAAQAAPSGAASVQATAGAGVFSAPPARARGPAAASSVGTAEGAVPQVARSGGGSMPADTVASVAAADHSPGAASGLAGPHCQGRDVADSPSSINGISGSSGSDVDSRMSSPSAAVADATGASIPAPPSSSGAAALTVAPASGSGATSGSASAEEGATALLVGNVDVSVTVMLPPALAAVPRPLLGMTGSLIARYAIASLLPSFLDLLVADYGRWSSGQTVSARAAPAGNLAAVAAANAAAMGVQQCAVRPQQAAPQPQPQPSQPQEATKQHAAAAEPPSVSSTTS